MIESILANTFNADPALRQEAERALNVALKQPNSHSAFVNFIGNKNNHRNLRLAAAIAVKNKARACWRADKLEEDAFVIPDAEKEYVRGMIVEVLFWETDSSIRGILADVVKVYAEFDYPERWPGLLPMLVGAISSQGNVLQMFNALVALRKLVKKFEYKPKEERQALDDIIHAVFPHLIAISANVLATTPTNESAQIVKMIFKIFWSSTMYALPLSASGLDVNAWFQLLAHVLGMDVPDETDDKHSRTQAPWWKAKKWSGRIMCQFIQRYGNPRYSGDEYTVFATYFKSTLANQLLTSVMKTLEKKSQGMFVTDVVHRMCLSFTANAVEMSPSYKAIKPHLDFLLFSVIFPTLCITSDDLALFVDDPPEFVRRINNPTEEWLDPRVAAINLLQMLARYRQKDTLPRFMPFLTAVLAEYSAQPDVEANCIKKDGVMVAVATMQRILHESSKYKSLVEPFLVSQVIPEFRSPVAFLRARACWYIEYAEEGLWKRESNMKAVLQGLLQGLRDPAVPVQAAAACSIRVLIEEEGAQEFVRPMLRDIVGEYFRIMDEVESDSVLSALQSIVSLFGEEVQDFAPLMAEKLVSFFYNFASAQNDEDDEAAFAASQCLDTIGAVLEAVQDVPSVLGLIEPIVLPLVLEILGNDEKNFGFDYIDNAVQILSFLTYFLDDVSVALWSACGPLLAALNTWAYDYIGEIAGPLLNYISKRPELFLSMRFPDGSLFVEVLLGVVERALTATAEGYDTEAKAACVLMTCLVTCCKGRLDEYIAKVLQMVLGRLLLPFKTSSLKHSVIDAGLAVIDYDPVFTMNAFKSNNEAPSTIFFNALFDALPHMEKTFSQRLIVLSFSTMLNIPATSLPLLVYNNFEAIFRQVIRELVLILEEEGEEDEEGAADEGDDEVDEDQETDRAKTTLNKWAVAREELIVPEDGYDEDEDCHNAEDETYREALEKLGAEGRVNRQLFLNGEPVDDDEDEQGFDYTSPVDNADVLGHFIGVLHTIASRDPELMARLQRSLDGEDTARLQELVKANSDRYAASNST